MHYAIGDIHNDNRRFSKILEKIGFSEEDHLFLLGDLFDRNLYEPDPIGVYFNVLKIEDRCSLVRGNHDTWLAQYIMNYYNTSERKRKHLAPYPYNSFAIFSEHFTEVDMLNLAKKIMEWPLQICVEVDGEKYLLAHAYTSMPDKVMVDEFYLMGVHFAGSESYEMFLLNGRKASLLFYNRVNVIFLMPNGEWYYKDMNSLCMEAKLCRYHLPISSGIVMRVRWRC